MLRRAERALFYEPRGVLHGSLQKTIAGLLEKADPNRVLWVEAFDKGASELVNTSQMYRRRKWSRIADRLLDDAESLSPAIAAKERERSARSSRSGSKKKSEVKKKAPTGPKDLMAKFRPSEAWGWDVGREIVKSPPLKMATHHLLGSIQCLKDAMVSLDVKRPDTQSQAAIIFGGRDYEDYFILDLIYYRGTDCQAIAYHWKAPNLKEIGTKRFRLSEEQRGDWVRYAVRIDGKRATFFIDEKELFSVPCEREPYGMIGMLISGISKYKDPVHYRKLFIYEPKNESKNEPVDGPKKIDTRLLHNISKAEKLLEDRKNEDATLILLDAQQEVRAHLNETLKKTLGDTIRKLIRRADRTNTRFNKTRVAAAASLVTLSKTYVEAKWYDVAGEILKRAAVLDRTATLDLRAALDAAIRAVVHKPAPKKPAAAKGPDTVANKTGGLAAEAQAPTKNLDLLMWFERGRQPYDTDAWRVSTEGVAAPVDRLGGSLILSTGKFGEKAAFSVQAKTTEKECVAGVAFGFKTIYSYYYVAWRHASEKGLTYVQMYRVQGPDTKRVGPTKTFRFSADARKKWMTLRIAYADKKVRIKLGNAPEFTVPVAAKSLAGNIGLYTVVLDSKQPLHFRNLVIEQN